MCLKNKYLVYLIWASALGVLTSCVSQPPIPTDIISNTFPTKELITPTISINTPTSIKSKPTITPYSPPLTPTPINSIHLPIELEIIDLFADTDCAQNTNPGIKCSGASMAWSPDGQWVAFLATREIIDDHHETLPLSPDIYLTDFTGQTQYRLTDFKDLPIKGYWGNISWTPDGTEIIFSNRIPEGYLYKINIEQAIKYPLLLDETTLLNIPNSFSEVLSPSISPNGNLIVYQIITYNTLLPKMMLLDLTNGNIQQLLADENWAYFHPVFSPDGNKVALTGEESTNPGYNIYTISSDGSNLKQLTFGNRDSDPNWSPDGKWIVFATEHDNGDLALIKADGNQLINLPLFGTDPAWSPDGKWITILSDLIDNKVSIYLVDMSWLEMEWDD